MERHCENSLVEGSEAGIFTPCGWFIIGSETGADWGLNGDEQQRLGWI